MSQQNAFKRILASLHEAMLDDTLWPGASALIDEACGITGNTLLVGEGPKDDVRAVFVGHYYRGQRREDLEREYLEVYHPIDERVPRLRQLPDSRLVHVTELYTAEELKTSPTYNEIMLRCDHQDSLNVRLAQLMADALPSSGAVALSVSIPTGYRDSGAEAGGASGGDLVGRRPERARHGRGDGTRHLLASDAYLHEAGHLPAGRSGAVGAVDRRVRISTVSVGVLGGRPGCRPLSLPSSKPY